MAPTQRGTAATRTEEPHRARPTGFPWAWLAYPLLVFIAMTTWAVSSPAGSSPDEDYHLASAWCANGFQPGICAPAVPGSRTVPYDVGAIACYAYKPDVSGLCETHPAQSLVTTRGNFVDYYPGGFYTTMGLFVGHSLDQSVMAMRILNAGIYALGLAALLLLSRPGHRENYMLASLVTLVPLGLFTVASVNPSSWAITSATLLWASGVEFIGATRRWHRVGLAILSILALVLALASRADAAICGALAIALVWFLGARSGRRRLVFGVIAGVLVVGASVWALSFGSLTQVASLPALNPTEPALGWLKRIVALPGFFVGTFGTRGLGWLDTVMPPIVWIPAAAAYVLALAWGLRRRDWRKVVALLVTLGGSAIVVDAIATLRHSMPERVLQPRYFLPLLILAAMVALAHGNDDGPQLHLGSRVLVVLGLGVAQAASLHTNLRRYLTGLDVHGWNLNDGIEWWWSWAPPPMVVLGVGSLAFLGALVVVGMASRRHSEPSMATLSE